jgi:hypothetical protein
MHDYRVVTMHPDCNMVFFHLRRGDDHPMISYDFDRREVRVVDTYKHHPTYKIIPFVPYLSELFLGALGAHKWALLLEVMHCLGNIYSSGCSVRVSSSNKVWTLENLPSKSLALLKAKPI